MIVHLIDKVFVEALRAGCPTAWRKLEKLFFKIILNQAIGMVVDIDDAKEIRQLVFIRIHKGVFKFNSDSDITTWIFMITKNACINLLKLRKLNLIKFISLDSNEKSKANQIADPYTPMNIIERKESQKIADATIANLKGMQLEVFTLWYVDGVSIPEIASMKKMTVGAIEQLLLRAKVKLRRFV